MDQSLPSFEHQVLQGEPGRLGPGCLGLQCFEQPSEPGRHVDLLAADPDPGRGVPDGTANRSTVHVGSEDVVSQYDLERLDRPRAAEEAATAFDREAVAQRIAQLVDEQSEQGGNVSRISCQRRGRQLEVETTKLAARLQGVIGHWSTLSGAGAVTVPVTR